MQKIVFSFNGSSGWVQRTLWDSFEMNLWMMMMWGLLRSGTVSNFQSLLLKSCINLADDIKGAGYVIKAGAGIKLKKA